ncbi:fimbrial protein [Enterobacter cloacae]|uniref:fimbrial protein n=1 Tax=Enterobacter cloacae TaxID=550 RepID=UPI00188A944E|nr:fimbrial protein [Enterobacter cloacae]MBF4114190.1 type 1 fimbrial protein [Enterobacter cloacae]
MKKRIIAMGVVFGLSLAASVFAASDNTITFQGEVTDQTCAVTVNGNAASPVVLLPTVSIGDFSNLTTAGATTFEVGVSGCTPDTKGDVKVSTVFVGNLVTNSGNLGNTGTASNVEIQILDTAGKIIDFTSNFNGDGDLTLTSGATSTSANYIAQYYITGTPTTGSVTSSLQYAVTYL